MGKFKPEVSELNSTSVRGNLSDGCEAVPSQQRRIMLGKHSTNGMIGQVGAMEDMSRRGERMLMGKLSEGRSHAYDETDDNNDQTTSHSLPKDPKTSLRFKIKKSSIENEKTHQEKTTIKGQRSKRKRPSLFMEKTSFNGDEDAVQSNQDNLMDEIMDANWILMKLGKDAIGKRVEVHQTSDNSWLVYFIALCLITESFKYWHATIDDDVSFMLFIKLI